MTEKQEKILETALHLFAQEGFDNTSTSKIAMKAGVSEGLIFRHFKNKEGLLEALINEGQDKVKRVFSDVIFEQDPREVIRKTIGIPYRFLEENREFWVLEYSLKFQRLLLNEKIDKSFMEPMLKALEDAFDELDYMEPRKEAELLYVLLEGILTRVLTQGPKDMDTLKDFIESKYKL
jgi:AcrR family transcriptional regulator